MTKNVMTVGPEDTLYRVRMILQKVGFHHLPVVTEGKKLLGVISDRDLLRFLSPNLGTNEETLKDRESLGKQVRHIMHKKVVAVNKEIDISSAARLMLKRSVSCLPVATMDGILEGIVTLRGLLLHFVEKETEKSSWRLPRKK
jgi:acetoin utilization protein AcuB